MPRRPRKARITKCSVEDFIRWELNEFGHVNGFGRSDHPYWTDETATAFYLRHKAEIHSAAEQEDRLLLLDQWIERIYAQSVRESMKAKRGG